MSHKVAVFRKEHFNAAHKLFCADWTDEKNKQVFGACSNPNYHGHNYELIVQVNGLPDPITGFVINTKDLSIIVEEEVKSRFDHKNLNEEVPEFKTLNPTAENIAVVIWNKLRAEIDNKLELSITLFETPRNFVTYSGED